MKNGAAPTRLKAMPRTTMGLVESGPSQNRGRPISGQSRNFWWVRIPRSTKQYEERMFCSDLAFRKLSSIGKAFRLRLRVNSANQVCDKLVPKD